MSTSYFWLRPFSSSYLQGGECRASSANNRPMNGVFIAINCWMAAMNAATTCLQGEPGRWHAGMVAAC